jgi:hypothetical protein
MRQRARFSRGQCLQLLGVQDEAHQSARLVTVKLIVI